MYASILVLYIYIYMYIFVCVCIRILPSEQSDDHTRSTAIKHFSSLPFAIEKRNKRYSLESPGFLHSYGIRFTKCLLLRQTAQNLCGVLLALNMSSSVTPQRTGRPPLFFANKPDAELTEEEKRLKAQILKRRERQKRAYRRKKLSRTVDSLNLESTKKNSTSNSAEEDLKLTHFTRSNLSSVYPSISQFITLRKCFVVELEQGLSSLDDIARKLLEVALVFPNSFTLEAATVVGNFANSKEVAETVWQLLWKGFLYLDEDIRLSLHPLVKRYLSWHCLTRMNSLDRRLSFEDTETTLYQYFYDQIKERVRDHKIYVSGLERKISMRFIDRERDNILVCLKYARRKNKQCLQDFLSNGGSIFRFGIGAENRLHYFGDALGLCCCSEFSCSSHSNWKRSQFNLPSNDSWNTEQEAILLYHLAESYADAMQWENAEIFARRSIQVIEKLHLEVSSSCHFPPLLLLGNILYETERLEEARVSVLSALDSIRRFGLHYSSYTANAYIILINIFLQEKDILSAQQTASELLEIVEKIGFHDLPLFSDTMGTFGLISYASGDYVEAERKLRLALESLRSWSCSYLWFDVPRKHCMHLDLWLMDWLSRVLNAQGKSEEADKFKERVEMIATERDICLRYVSDTSVTPHRWTFPDLGGYSPILPYEWKNNSLDFVELENTQEVASNDSWNTFSLSMMPSVQRVFMKHVC
jgi:tetratricopeptide (TPR) repeat protein